MPDVKAPKEPQKPPEDEKREIGVVGRVQRAQRIAIARAQSPAVPWDKIAADEDLSRTQCHRILADYQAEDLALGDPLGLVRETLSIFNRSIELLGEMAENEKHVAYRTGAIRLLLEALGARIQLMVAAGLMPKRLSAQKDHDDAMVLVRKMAEVIQRHDLNDEVVDELIEVVGGAPALIEGSAE